MEEPTKPAESGMRKLWQLCDRPGITELGYTLMLWFAQVLLFIFVLCLLSGMQARDPDDEMMDFQITELQIALAWGGLGLILHLVIERFNPFHWVVRWQIYLLIIFYTTLLLCGLIWMYISGESPMPVRGGY